MSCNCKSGVGNTLNEEIKEKAKNVQFEKYGMFYSQTEEYKDDISDEAFDFDISQIDG